MARFKLHNNLGLEINAIRTAGNDLNSEYKKLDMGNIIGLVTASKYKKLNSDIKNLFELYSKLVDKDAIDLLDMLETSFGLDAIIGNSFIGGGCIMKNPGPKMHSPLSILTDTGGNGGKGGFRIDGSGGGGGTSW